MISFCLVHIYKFTFCYLQGDVNRFIPFVIFGALSITAGLLAMVLPETKGQQLPESIEDGENFPQ